MKLEVNIEKRYAFLILAGILVLASVFVVYAYKSGQSPAVFGHSAEELEITLANGSTTTLQSAINKGWIGGSQTQMPSSCSLGQVLSYNSSGWNCVANSQVTYNETGWGTLTSGSLGNGVGFVKKTGVMASGSFTGYNGFEITSFGVYPHTSKIISTTLLTKYYDNEAESIPCISQGMDNRLYIACPGYDSYSNPVSNEQFKFVFEVLN